MIISAVLSLLGNSGGGGGGGDGGGGGGLMGSSGGGGGGLMGSSGGGGGAAGGIGSAIGGLFGGSGGGGGGGNGIGNLWGHSMGSKIGGLANGIFNLFFAKNPSDAADPYLQQMEGGAAKYLQPYLDVGARARPVLEAQYNRNINDPTSVMSQIGKNFQASPGYQYQVDEATRAANNSAAASGMAGTPAEQQRLATVVNGLANQDYYNFMDRGLNQYNSGLGGLSHQNDLSYGASSQMVQAILQQLMAQAQNAYAGANTYNQQKGGAIGSITGSLF